MVVQNLVKDLVTPECRPGMLTDGEFTTASNAKKYQQEFQLCGSSSLLVLVMTQGMYLSAGCIKSGSISMQGNCLQVISLFIKTIEKL